MDIDIISGYTNYREEKHIFILKEYKVCLIPCNEKNNITYKINSVFEVITEKKNNGFINDFILNGICANGMKINMCVQDYSWIEDGGFCYNVKWIYLYNYDKKKPSIKGINFTSQEINFYYNAKYYIKDKFEINEDSFKNYELSIKSKKRKLLGLFK